MPWSALQPPRSLRRAPQRLSHCNSPSLSLAKYLGEGTSQGAANESSLLFVFYCGFLLRFFASARRFASFFLPIRGRTTKSVNQFWHFRCIGLDTKNAMLPLLPEKSTLRILQPYRSKCSRLWTLTCFSNVGSLKKTTGQKNSKIKRKRGN